MPDAESSNNGAEAPSCGELSECEEACGNGDPAGCENAGRMYETGEGADQDYQRAAKLYDQACEGGREEACAHLAMMYDIGLAVEEDPDKANTLYKKACASGNRWACKRGEQLEHE
jgi:TPR repeat protein